MQIFFCTREKNVLDCFLLFEYLSKFILELAGYILYASSLRYYIVLSLRYTLYTQRYLIRTGTLSEQVNEKRSRQYPITELTM